MTVLIVDDIIVTGNKTEDIIKLKRCLVKKFEMEDLGTLHYFLGIEVARFNKGNSISQ